MQNKIRILYVVQSLSHNGGIEETLRILCQYLDRKIFHLGICSIQDTPEQILKIFRQWNIEIFCLKRRAGIADALATWKIKKIIGQFQADIVHTHNSIASWHGRLASLLQGDVAILTTFHNLTNIIFAKDGSIRKKRANYKRASSQSRISALLYPWANYALNGINTRVIFVSQAVQEGYSSTSKRAFEVVNSPYDNHIFQAKTLSKRSDSIVLGTVGRLVWQKGHIFLLKAMKNLIMSHPSVSLKIIGKGDQESALIKWRGLLGLKDHIEFCGDRPHNAELYKTIDLYIQPSISEGCPITLLEAMGSKIPVIATDQGGHKELIQSGSNGLLVPAENPMALQAAIVDLINNPGKRNNLAQTGFETASRYFSASVFIEKMKNIYLEALNEKNGQDGRTSGGRTPKAIQDVKANGIARLVV